MWGGPCLSKRIVGQAPASGLPGTASDRLAGATAAGLAAASVGSVSLASVPRLCTRTLGSAAVRGGSAKELEIDATHADVDADQTYLQRLAQGVAHPGTTAHQHLSFIPYLEVFPRALAQRRDRDQSLGKEIVARYHDQSAADEAATRWDAQFAQKQVPDDMPEHTLESEDGALWLPKVLTGAGLVPSTSEARRRITQGAVSVDGEKLSDPKAKLESGKTYVIKAGKRAWARVTLS